MIDFMNLDIFGTLVRLNSINKDFRGGTRVASSMNVADPSTDISFINVTQKLIAIFCCCSQVMMIARTGSWRNVPISYLGVLFYTANFMELLEIDYFKKAYKFLAYTELAKMFGFFLACSKNEGENEFNNSIVEFIKNLYKSGFDFRSSALNYSIFTKMPRVGVFSLIGGSVFLLSSSVFLYSSLQATKDGDWIYQLLETSLFMGAIGLAALKPELRLAISGFAFVIQSIRIADKVEKDGDSHKINNAKLKNHHIVAYYTILASMLYQLAFYFSFLENNKMMLNMVGWFLPIIVPAIFSSLKESFPNIFMQDTDSSKATLIDTMYSPVTLLMGSLIVGLVFGFDNKYTIALSVGSGISSIAHLAMGIKIALPGKGDGWSNVVSSVLLIGFLDCYFGFFEQLRKGDIIRESAKYLSEIFNNISTFQGGVTTFLMLFLGGLSKLAQNESAISQISSTNTTISILRSDLEGKDKSTKLDEDSKNANNFFTRLAARMSNKMFGSVLNR